MSNADPESSEPVHGEEGEAEHASTPFDNPFFLPVVLLGFSVWFFYDGWFNPDMEWLKFNRVGASITVVLGCYFLFKALRERNAKPR